jgi:hypothetical protein
VHGAVELVDLVVGERAEDPLPLTFVAGARFLGDRQARRGQLHHDLAPVGRIGRPPHEAGALEPVEDLSHATARAQHDLGELARRQPVRLARELEYAQHRVVDEPQTERVEAAVLERVDEEPDARQAREQPDCARL